MGNIVVRQDFGLELFLAKAKPLGQGHSPKAKAKASLLQGQGHKIWP